MSDGVRIEKRDRGDLWFTFLLCCFQDGQFLVWGQGGNAWGLLLAVVAGAGGGLGHIPSAPPRLVLAGVAHS